MKAEAGELVCPVLRKLVALLETHQGLGTIGPRPAFWARLAEIELDALVLNAAPSTHILIRVAREVMTFSEEITARAVRT